MSQEDIYNLLIKHKEPLPRFKIAEILKENPCKVSKHINTLLTHNEIKCIEISRTEARKMFKGIVHYRRLRLYYIENSDSYNNKKRKKNQINIPDDIRFNEILDKLMNKK